VAALVSSLFFQGVNLYAFLTTQILLVGLFTYQLMRLYGNNITLRIDLLTATLLVLWLWLAVSVLWSQVPYISGITFWWVGVLPIVYLIYVLSPEIDASWSPLVSMLFIVGVVLSLVGLYQFILLNDSPRGPFIYRNLLAAFLNMLILVLSARFLLPVIARDPPVNANDSSVIATQSKAKGKQSHTTNRISLFEGLHKQSYTNYDRPLMLAGIFFLILTVGLIRSRGAILCLSVGMLCLVMLVRPHVYSKRELYKIIAAFVIALALAQVSTAGEMGERLLTLKDPYSAGTDRFIIWKASWKMILDGPWYGIGLGTYWFAWPPYRPAGESSAGFFVHNDYLQIVIEGGWPALFSLLAILAAIACTFFSTYRNVSVDGSVKIETTGLVAAMLSVFLHNVFDFNLYSIPTMILAGLSMGRLHTLCRKTAPGLSLEIPLSRWFRLPVFKTCLILLALFPMAYLFAMGISYFHYQKGNALIKTAQLKKADDALHVAELLWPAYDLPKYLRGSIYQVTISANPHLDKATVRQLFQESEKKLKQARSLNPWRPEIFIVFARLYEQSRDLAGRDWHEKAEKFYRQALAVDPRCYDARISYAGMLAKSGDLVRAATVLKEGIKHWYPEDYRILPYYRLTSSVCKQVGDSTTADKMDILIARIVPKLKISPTAPLERPF